jgi:poly-gamma-glutamate capsule biosynthesis protein CapA/YwtB (metallophosphatase superfamily)
MTIYGSAHPDPREHRQPSRPGRSVIVIGVVVVVLLAAGAASAAASGWFSSGPAKPSAAISLIPTAPKTPTTKTPTASAGQVTLSGVGDVIMGTGPSSLPPRDGQGYFDDVASSLKSDLVMGNLEQALSDDTGHRKCNASSTGCFAFHLPPRYSNVLKAGGFDLVNLANNHTMDMGTGGLTSTHNALDAAGVHYTGAPGQITVTEAAGVKVAVIGVAPYPWCQSLTDIASSAALVRQATTMADLVVIQMQAGAEGVDKNHVHPGTETFLSENRGDVIKFSHAMIDAGADIVIGHGPHVMRGMQFYKGHLIAFSLGNFTGYKTLKATGYLGVSGILKVTLTADGRWVSGTLIATDMVKGGLPALDPNKRALSFVRGLSQGDFGAAAAHIASDGTITPPTS